MGTQFISSGIWDEITKAVRKRPSKCHIAVAFFSTGGIKRLPLRDGSTLVVNMGDDTVRAGLTKPVELLPLLRDDVAVYTVENLHAKVFVVGDEAFVASSNVSSSSANDLIEAGIRTTSPAVVRECREFVRALAGAAVTPHLVRQKQKLWKPRKGIRAQRRANTAGRGVAPAHPPVWVVPLIHDDRDDEDKKQAKAGHSAARKKLRSSRLYRVEDFKWESDDFIDRLEVGHIVVPVVEESGNTVMVEPAQRVVHARRYRAGRQRRALFFTETPRRSRRRSVDLIVEKLGTPAKFLKKLDHRAVRLQDPLFVHSLLNLMPSRALE